jgi:hypothetical protein
MSEPYSAMAQFQISPAALKSYLAVAARPTSHWPDWADLCGREDATGQQQGLPFSLHGDMDFDSVDRWLSEGDYRSHLRAILGVAELPSLARFDYDEQGLLTIVNLTVATESFRSPLWFLATIRGAADYVDGPGGLAVIRNYVWGGPESKYTMAVLRLEPGGSRFLHSAHDADAYSDAVCRANAAFDGIDLNRHPPDDGKALANLGRL